MRFLVRIYRHKKDYSALVQDLPGCVAAGDSIEEVRTLITEAISMHLDLMTNSGEKIPKPRQRTEFVINDESEDEEFCTWVEVQVPTNRKTSIIR